MNGFLDDKLYNHLKNKDITSGYHFNKVINELFKICEDHFKPQLLENMTRTNAKMILDRTFNSWDLFVSRLEKEKYQFADILKKYSYKEIFMSNEEMKKMYLSLTF